MVFSNAVYRDSMSPCHQDLFEIAKAMARQGKESLAARERKERKRKKWNFKPVAAMKPWRGKPRSMPNTRTPKIFGPRRREDEEPRRRLLSGQLPRREADSSAPVGRLLWKCRLLRDRRLLRKSRFALSRRCQALHTLLWWWQEEALLRQIFYLKSNLRPARVSM